VIARLLRRAASIADAIGSALHLLAHLIDTEDHDG